MAVDFNNLRDRKAVLSDIHSEENKSRKAESLKRFEVYRGRIARYIIEKLETEFTRKTISEMRTQTSINLCPRMINAQASIYNKAPVRNFGRSRNQPSNFLDDLSC